MTALERLAARLRIATTRLALALQEEGLRVATADLTAADRKRRQRALSRRDIDPSRRDSHAVTKKSRRDTPALKERARAPKLLKAKAKAKAKEGKAPGVRSLLAPEAAPWEGLDSALAPPPPPRIHPDLSPGDLLRLYHDAGLKPFGGSLTKSLAGMATLRLTQHPTKAWWGTAFEKAAGNPSVKQFATFVWFIKNDFNAIRCYGGDFDGFGEWSGKKKDPTAAPRVPGKYDRVE